MNYNEYTVCIGNDPTNYGQCTPEEAVSIADTLQAMVESEFTGIIVRRTDETGAPTPTRGPDSAVCDEIHQWIQDHWTAAL